MRSLPDIFKAPWFYVHVEDTVEIPDAPERPVEAEEDKPDEEALLREAGEDEDEDEDGERRIAERRTGERRTAGRRLEDEDMNPENLLRRYRERLVMTKEEFFDEVKPDLLEALRKQMEEIRNEAFREELIRQERGISQALETMERGMQTLEQNHRDYMKEFTEELKYMALDIAERMLRKELDEDRHALGAMVLELVSEVKNTDWINVEISDQIEGLAEYLKTQLERAEQGKPIYVETKDGPPDLCRIVTEEGAVDATLSIQLKQLREAFVNAEQEGD